MDTLKSYFSRILPNNHTRKGSGRWKGGRNKDRRGVRGFPDAPFRSASTSQMDLDSCGAEASYYMTPEPLSSFSSFDKGPKPKSLSDFAPSGQQSNTLGRDSARTPPPSKPPRKDQVFTVDLLTNGASELGIEVDAVHISSRDRLGSYDGNAATESSWSPRSTVAATPPPVSQGSGFGSLPPATPGCVIRVVGLKEGGVARRDGRIKINDELIDVNGKSLLRESKESVRKLLRTATQSGRVVMTFRRRRRKSTAPPPFLFATRPPCRSPLHLQTRVVLGAALSNNSLSFSTNCLPVDAWAGGRDHASVDNDDSYFASNPPVSLSSCDLNDSSDDVFADSTTPSDKVVYINLPHLRFHRGGKGLERGRGREGGVAERGGLLLGDSVENLDVDALYEGRGGGVGSGAGGAGGARTKSSSAVEDIVHWSSPESSESNNNSKAGCRQYTVHPDRSRDSTPNGGLDLRRQSSTSTLVGTEQNSNTNFNNTISNSTNSTTTRQDSVESLSGQGSSRMNGHSNWSGTGGASSVTPIRRLVERNLLKNHQQEMFHGGRSETASPATVSLGSYGGYDGNASSSSSSSSLSRRARSG